MICFQNNAWAGKDTFGFNLGPGWSTVDDGVTFLGSFSYQSRRTLFTFRALGTGAAILDKGKNMYDCGLLYNYAFSSPSLHISAGTGLAVVGGEADHTGFSLFSISEKETIGPMIGLPIDIQIFLRPLPFLGVGLYGFGNINAEETFVGAALCLQLGKVK